MRYDHEISNLYWYSLYQASRITSRGRAKQSTYELIKLNVGWEFLKALLFPVPSYHGLQLVKVAYTGTFCLGLCPGCSTSTLFGSLHGYSQCTISFLCQQYRPIVLACNSMQSSKNCVNDMHISLTGVPMGHKFFLHVHA